MFPPEPPLKNCEVALAVLPADELHDRAREAQRESRPLQRALQRWEQIRRDGPVTTTQERYVNHYVVEEQLMYRLDGDRKLLVIPRLIAKDVIQSHHEVDHPGAKETFRRIRRKYYCRGLERQVYKYVRNCLTCSQIKAQQRQPPAPLRTHHPRFPFQTLSIDVLGPYIVTPTGNRFALVVEDTFSKWTEAKAYPAITGKDVVTFLNDEIVTRYGTPETIITDNGGVFKNRVFQKWCEDRHITARSSAIWHQRANPVERRVQEMKKLLRLFAAGAKENQWDTCLPQVMSTLRRRQNQATGETPSKLVLGYELPEDGEWKIPSYVTEREQPTDREALIQEAFQRQTHYKQKYAPDQVPTMLKLNPGQFVLIRNQRKRRDVFQPPWIGPFEVVSRISDEVYEVNKDGVLSQIYVDDIRPAPRGNDQFEWLSEEEPDEPPEDDQYVGEPEAREAPNSQTREELDPVPSRSSPTHEYEVTNLPLSTRMQRQMTEETSMSHLQPHTGHIQLRKDSTPTQSERTVEETTDFPLRPESLPRASTRETDGLEVTSPSTSHFKDRPTLRHPPNESTLPESAHSRRRRRSRLVIRDKPPPL